MPHYQEILDKFKIPIALSLVGIVLIIGGLVSSSVAKKPTEYPKESLINGTKQIKVDVSGAVNNPGVYTLSDGSRIEQAVEAAGGIKQGANLEFISKNINLAQKLLDGVKIYIPFAGDPTSSGFAGLAGQGSVSGISTSGQININSASQSELEALSGIGPVTASKIVAGRPYSSPEELLDKKILGKAVFEKIKSTITVY